MSFQKAILPRSTLRSNDENSKASAKPLKYGDFLYPGRRVYSSKRQYLPKLEEFADILDNTDHYIPLEELAAKLDTDVKQGLKKDQIELIRERYGENVVSYSRKVTLFEIINRVRGTHYFLCIGIVFCFTTAAIPQTQPPAPYAFDNLYIGLIMMLMIIISVYISYWFEIKCSRIMDSFKVLYPQYASVIRDGNKVRIHKNEVVVGDLILLKAGNNIPADVRITKAWNLIVDESSLIHGLSTRIKTAECTSKNPLTSENVTFHGTSCIDGYGQGIVISTGDRTAYGQMMKKATVLQKMNTAIHKDLRNVLFCIGTHTLSAGVILLAMVLREHYSWITLVVIILAQVIDSMPNILYSTITVSLYTAAKNMVSKNCLPKNFDAVNSLGSITVICCDKTGTITQNRMTVIHLWIDNVLVEVSSSEIEETIMHPSPDKNTWLAFSRAASLCSTIASKSRRKRCIIRKGCSCDQTEVAIMEFLNSVTADSPSKEIVDVFRKLYKKVYEIPYNSYTKYHVTIHDTSRSFDIEESHFLLCMKGAVEEILKFCSTVLINGENEPITVLEDLLFQKTFESTMESGERIIGFCDYYMPKEKYTPGYEFQESDIPITGLRFLGFVSMVDPPRASVPEAIEKCRKAGIKVVLITGDHPITGKAIAKQVGIISKGSMTKKDVMQKYSVTPQEVSLDYVKTAVVTGTDLEFMEEEDIQNIIRMYEEFVFARISPHLKIKIVEGFQKWGEIVAVTGDSSEDAIAMQKADISIGMGMHGCDVSRDAADVILLGDNFATIFSAIEEGRTTYCSLQKAMVYALSSNVPQFFPFFIMGLIRIPFPIGASFILLNNLIAKIFPVLYFAKEKNNSDISTKINVQNQKFFDRRIFEKANFQVGIVGVLSSMFIYFLIMAQNGFMPSRIFTIVKQWESPAINDLVDSFNQEWDYSSRKSLEYTCQTAFFVSIIILQFFNFATIRANFNRKGCHCSFQFLVSSIFSLGCQLMIILLLMYTPVISKALHFYPLKITDWLLCLPFPFLLLAYEEFRRYFIRNSPQNSWLQRETF